MQVIVVELLAKLPVWSTTLTDSVIVAGVVASDGARHLTDAPLSVNVPTSAFHWNTSCSDVVSRSSTVAVTLTSSPASAKFCGSLRRSPRATIETIISGSPETER